MLFNVFVVVQNLDNLLIINLCIINTMRGELNVICVTQLKPISTKDKMKNKL